MTKAERMHRKQLEKVALIANVDLDALTPGEHLKLQADLRDFLSGSGIHMQVRVEGITEKELLSSLVPSRYVREVIDALREKFIEIAVIAAAGVNADLAVTPLIQPTKEPYSGFDLAETANVTLRVRSDSRSQPFRFLLLMEPNANTAKWALLFHLAHSNLSPDRVRFCPRDGCGNVFVLGSHARTDRMRYCSIKCSQLVATKAYRERKVKKDQERKAKGKRKVRRKEQVARLTAAAGKGARK